jgi:hypothetical protein
LLTKLAPDVKKMHASDCIAGDGCIVATLVGAPQYFAAQHDEETGPVVEAVAVTGPTQQLTVVGNEREKWQHLTPHQREMVMKYTPTDGYFSGQQGYGYRYTLKECLF